MARFSTSAPSPIPQCLAATPWRTSAALRYRTDSGTIADNRMSRTSINPAKLLHSKWTAVVPRDREKHFLVTAVSRDGERVTSCVIEAVHSRREFEIDWRELKNPERWRQGWH